MNSGILRACIWCPAASDDEDGDDESDADDNMDDAAMFRMDSKMAAYLRNMVDARK